METTSTPEEWTLNIRPYDPSEDPSHYETTDDYSGVVIQSRDVSKH